MGVLHDDKSIPVSLMLIALATALFCVSSFYQPPEPDHPIGPWPPTVTHDGGRCADTSSAGECVVFVVQQNFEQKDGSRGEAWW